VNAYRHRDAVLADELAIALDSLLCLEEASRGEPKHFAYETACLAVDALRTALRDQLREASRNAYYHQPKGAEPCPSSENL
jgi:hypothetical protein